jgi:hypothetical protein
MNFYYYLKNLLSKKKLLSSLFLKYKIEQSINPNFTNNIRRSFKKKLFKKKKKLNNILEYYKKEKIKKKYILLKKLNKKNVYLKKKLNILTIEQILPILKSKKIINFIKLFFSKNNKNFNKNKGKKLYLNTPIINSNISNETKYIEKLKNNNIKKLLKKKKNLLYIKYIKNKINFKNNLKTNSFLEFVFNRFVNWQLFKEFNFSEFFLKKKNSKKKLFIFREIKLWLKNYEKERLFIFNFKNNLFSKKENSNFSNIPYLNSIKLESLILTKELKFFLFKKIVVFFFLFNFFINIFILFFIDNYLIKFFIIIFNVLFFYYIINYNNNILIKIIDYFYKKEKIKILYFLFKPKIYKNKILNFLKINKINQFKKIINKKKQNNYFYYIKIIILFFFIYYFFNIFILFFIILIYLNKLFFFNIYFLINKIYLLLEKINIIPIKNKNEINFIIKDNVNLKININNLIKERKNIIEMKQQELIYMLNKLKK